MFDEIRKKFGICAFITHGEQAHMDIPSWIRAEADLDLLCAYSKWVYLVTVPLFCHVLVAVYESDQCGALGKLIWQMQ